MVLVLSRWHESIVTYIDIYIYSEVAGGGGGAAGTSAPTLLL